MLGAMLTFSDTRSSLGRTWKGLPSGRALLQSVYVLLLSLPTFAEESSTFFFEAETDAEVVPPAAVLSLFGASGGKCVCISAPDAVRMVRESEERRGSVVFRPTLDRPGDYFLWVRLRWHCQCSRVLSLRTSGQLRSDSRSEAGVLVDPEPPGTWRWICHGPFFFPSGPQTIAFSQRGHLALIDSIALTTDPDFKPPGFTEPNEALKIEAASEEWRAIDGGLFIQTPSEREWSSFLAEVVFDFRPGSLSAAKDSVGVQFAVQPDGACYRLLCSPTERESEWSVDLRRGTESILVATGIADLNRDYCQHLRVLRIGGRVVVSVNGVPALETTDNSLLVSGQIALLSTKPVFGAYEHLLVEPLSSYVETFAATETDWETLAGKWSVVAPVNPDSNRDGGYTAIADRMNLSLAPVAFGNEYRFEAKMLLAGEGYGGLAFDVLDGNNFMAFVYQENSASQEDKFQVRLLEFQESELRTVLEKPVRGRPGQWRDLSILHREGSISVSLDGDTPWLLPSPVSEGGKGIGLVASGNSHALFTSPRASDYVEGIDRQFLFEPDQGIQSLCHWLQEEGRFSLYPHPAVLMCQAQPGRRDFALALRRRLPPRFETTVALWERGADPANRNRVVEDALPPIALPVLPGDPRLGIGFRLGKPGDEAGQTEYRMSVDLRDMCDLAVFRDGEKVTPESPVGTGDRMERRLFLRLSGGWIEAGVRGGVHTRIGDLPSLGPDLSAQVFFFAENLEEGQRIDIEEMTVRELFDL